MEENLNTNKLARNFTIGSLFLFGLPSIGLQLWTGIYTIIDSVFAAMYNSTDALSAINISYPILCVEEAIGGMLATGASAIIAKKLGEGKAEEGGRNLSMICILAALLGLIWGVVVCIIGEPLYRLLGADDTLLPLVTRFVSVHRFFAPFYTLQIAFQALLFLAGKPTKAMVITVGAGIINIVGDVFFMGFLHMDIGGAALGGGSGMVFAAIASLICVANHNDELHLRRPSVDAGLAARSCAGGAGDLMWSIAMATMTALFNINTMKYFGPDGCAAGAILLYAQFLFIAPFYGFGKGTSPIIAYRYGTGIKEKLHDIFSKYTKLFIGVILVTGIASFFLATPVLSLYAKPEEPVFQIAKSAWFIFSAQYIFAGVNYMTQYLFTAFEDGKRAGFISALHGIILPNVMLLILPNVLHGIGVWLSIPVAEIISALVGVIMIISGNKVYNYYPAKRITE